MDPTLLTALFGILSFAAGLVSLGNAVYLAPHWRTPSAGKLILLQVSVAVWAMGYGMEFFSPTLVLVTWWAKLEYFGVSWTSLLLLDFILTVTHKERYLPRKGFALLCLIPVITILLVLTNDAHHLVWERIWLADSGLIPMAAYQREPWFWVFVTFSYGLLTLSTLILIQALGRAADLMKKQVITILVGIAFPWMANILYLGQIQVGPLPDLTPLAFTISGLAFAWGLMRYQMLSLIPLAHDIIIGHMGDPVISLDSEDRILDANQAARQFFSLEPGRPGSRRLGQAFPALHRLLSDRSEPEVSEAEITLESVQGPGDWEMRIFPLATGRGRPSGRLVMLRDVTRRKQNQAALVESERIHRTMLEAAPNPVVLYDDQIRVIRINPAFTRVFGWTQEELVGHAIDFFPDGNSRELLDAFRATVERKKIHDYITQRRTKSGDLRDVSINAALCRSHEGGGTSIVVNFTDITQIKATETELRQARNHIRSIIDAMPSVLIGLDGLGRVTQWNTAAERVTGHLAATVEGEPLERVFPQLAARLPDVNHVIGSREPKTASRVTLELQAGPMAADITVYPVDSARGAVVRLDDVGDRIRMEELMVQSEKMMSVGGLAAGMAHEINNPLAGMLQSLQVIRNRLTRPIPANRDAAAACGLSLEHLNAYLETRQVLTLMDLMAESGKRAAQIVSNMLSFSRKSGQTKSLHSLPTILNATVDLIRSGYSTRQSYDFKSIEIRTDYAPDLPAVPCRQGELQQVLLNILTNGAEAMLEAGTPSPCFTLICRRNGDSAVIEVRDNGPGMDAATRKRIFEPFFTTKEVGLGTGLGLSVSYFIITENHGGTLEVASEPGQGARFTITLPLASGSPGSAGQGGGA